MLFNALLLASSIIAVVDDDIEVLRLDFEERAVAPIREHGNVHWDEAGPRPPEFPDFIAENSAVRLDGNGSRLALTDPGSASRFDFTNGDAITIEAWVKLDGLRDNNLMYVVGKGRTGSKRFAADNQNWALRIVGNKGVARLSFLFATKRKPASAHWHRWTSRAGFAAATGWHHVAASYRFGDPDSIRGWIDGRPTDGTWDLGGPTKEAPIVDDDDVWLGSSLGGNPANSFRGWMDAVLVHRAALETKTIAARFHRVGGPRVIEPRPPVMPELGVLPASSVTATIGEGMPAVNRWLNEDEDWPDSLVTWPLSAFLLPRIPIRYDDWGIRSRWKAPVLLRLAADVPFRRGTHRLLLRARGLGRLWIDGRLALRTVAATGQPPNGEEPVTPLRDPPAPGHRVAGYHQQEVIADFEVLDDQTSRVVLEVLVGGPNYRTESGEVCVAVKWDDRDDFEVLRPVVASQRMPLTDEALEPLLADISGALRALDDSSRRRASSSQDAFWQSRHAAARDRVMSRGRTTIPWKALRQDANATSGLNPVDAFLADLRNESKTIATAPAQLDDYAFLRRVYLDTVGVIPTPSEIERFLADDKTDRRVDVIDRLLDDERLADHWMSFWLDLLAENPTLLNASLNSTGPFRWFLYDALRDHKSLDRLVTELIMMRGDPYTGGSAGFALAGENDAPLAAKAHILASGFLAIELQCARCHDSPFHSTTQRDLYGLAAMMRREAVKIPKSSRVPDAFFADKDRESLIEVSLAPSAQIPPSWPFAERTGVVDDARLDPLTQNPRDSRERLAALITSPQNRRFAPVMVNRLWREFMGVALVEPLHDWEAEVDSPPQLIQWLADELVLAGYDVRRVMRRILTSDAYSREGVARDAKSPFARTGPIRRRLTAEQIVDSLFVATGNEMDVGELTFVHDGRRQLSNRQTLGRPTRAWMFASLNNERDRPSLSLPKPQMVVDVLEAFGWTGSRQAPITSRDEAANVLQPGILANGRLVMTLTRSAVDTPLAELAVDATSPEALVANVFARVLTRQPRPAELSFFAAALGEGFASRIVPAAERAPIVRPQRLPLVTWFNHLRPQANVIQTEIERRVQRGPPADPRLQPEWRTIYEDFVWSLVNHREFVWGR